MRDFIDDLKYMISRDNTKSRKFYLTVLICSVLTVLIVMILGVLAILGITTGPMRSFSMMFSAMSIVIVVIVWVFLATRK